VTFGLAVMAKDATLIRHIEIDKKDHGIYLNYFQQDYRPGDLARGFTATQPVDDVPLILFEVDKVALPAYLAKHGLEEWVRIVKSKDIGTMSFNDFGQANVITSKPKEVLAGLQEVVPELGHIVLYRRLDFHKVLLLDRHGQARARMQPLATFEPDIRLVGLQMPERVNGLRGVTLAVQWQFEGPGVVFANYSLTTGTGEMYASSGWHRLSNNTNTLPHWVDNPITYDSWTPNFGPVGESRQYDLSAEVFICAQEECSPEREASGYAGARKLGSVAHVGGDG
jgi:hypothetical protein